MSDPFDPYLHWLGIREPERPPNYYRLLGVEMFEDDPAVLSQAVERQMARVHAFHTEENAAESQRLTSELATAKVCLLDAAKKAAYDGRLLAKLSRGTVEPPPVIERRPPAPAEAPAPVESQPANPPPTEPPTTEPVPVESAPSAIERPGDNVGSMDEPPDVTPEPSPPAPATERPRGIPAAPSSSSSMLLVLLGMVILMVLGLTLVWRNVNALRNEVINRWGIPTDVSGDRDTRDAQKERDPARQPHENRHSK